MTHTRTLQIDTEGFSDVRDLTPSVQETLRSSAIRNGIATVFVPGSTAAITTIEYEEGAVNDLKRAIERIAPRSIHYDHDARWGDGNGFAHIRASLMGPSLCVPVAGGRMLLGTWQQIVLVDFDNRPRSRDVVVHIVGERGS